MITKWSSYRRHFLSIYFYIIDRKEKRQKRKETEKKRDRKGKQKEKEEWNLNMKSSNYWEKANSGVFF